MKVIISRSCLGVWGDWQFDWVLGLGFTRKGREGLYTCICGIECALARAREFAEDGDGGGRNFGVDCRRVGVGGELILAIAIAGFRWCFVWCGRGREC